MTATNEPHKSRLYYHRRWVNQQRASGGESVVDEYAATPPEPEPEPLPPEPQPVEADEPPAEESTPPPTAPPQPES